MAREFRSGVVLVATNCYTLPYLTVGVPAQFDADAARYERGEQKGENGGRQQRPDDRIVRVGHVRHQLVDARTCRVALVGHQRRN